MTKKPKLIKVDKATYKIMCEIFGPNNGYDVEITDKEVKDKDGRQDTE